MWEIFNLWRDFKGTSLYLRIKKIFKLSRLELVKFDCMKIWNSNRMKIHFSIKILLLSCIYTFGIPFTDPNQKIEKYCGKNATICCPYLKPCQKCSQLPTVGITLVQQIYILCCILGRRWNLSTHCSFCCRGTYCGCGAVDDKCGSLKELSVVAFPILKCVRPLSNGWSRFRMTKSWISSLSLYKL